MISAVLTSDNHLGANYARYRPDRLEQRREILCASLRHVVDGAITRKVDLFLHAGDLFDRPDPRNKERLFVAEQLQRLKEANIPVFAIAGNHDSPKSIGYGGGITPQAEIKTLGGLHLFQKTDALESYDIEIRNQKVRIWGKSSDFNCPTNLCPLADMTLPQRDPQYVQIVLLHYGVQGWLPQIEEELREPVLSLDNLERIGAEVIGVGHLHRRNTKTLRSGALLINPGSTEHINFGEESLKCGYEVITIGDRVHTEQAPLLSQPMKTLPFHVTSEMFRALGEDAPTQATRFAQLCLKQIIGQATSDTLLRVQLIGAIPREVYHAFPWDEFFRLIGNQCFYAQIETERLSVFDRDVDTLLGYGVNFDVRDELQQVVLAFFNASHDENERLLLLKVEQEILNAYDSLVGGN